MALRLFFFKHIYLQLQISEYEQMDNIFPSSTWKSGCPLKIIIFAWLVFYNRNLTWENLQKRNLCGLAIWPLCRSKVENNLHIFLLCPQSQMIWRNLAAHFGYTNSSYPSISEAFNEWSNMIIEWRPIPFITIWAIWKWRNGTIFKSKRESHSTVFESIICLYNALGMPHKSKVRKGRCPQIPKPTSIPRAYFDGAAQHDTCSCGVYIIP